MGCLSLPCRYNEKPVGGVSIPRPFALSVHEITFEDYARFTDPDVVDDFGWGRGKRPLINVSWHEAQEYVDWLSVQTGQPYRLPSEAEWEYAARAGTTTKYPWGDDIEDRARCRDCGTSWWGTAPVGSYPPNAFGLHDMNGNVAEWVQDCRNANYDGAPSDGSAWLTGNCSARFIRGGAWDSPASQLRNAARLGLSATTRAVSIGFRVARALGSGTQSTR